MSSKQMPFVSILNKFGEDFVKRILEEENYELPQKNILKSILLDEKASYNDATNSSCTPGESDNKHPTGNSNLCFSCGLPCNVLPNKESQQNSNDGKKPLLFESNEDKIQALKALKRNARSSKSKLVNSKDVVNFCHKCEIELIVLNSIGKFAKQLQNWHAGRTTMFKKSCYKTSTVRNKSQMQNKIDCSVPNGTNQQDLMLNPLSEVPSTSTAISDVPPAINSSTIRTISERLKSLPYHFYDHDVGMGTRKTKRLTPIKVMDTVNVKIENMGKAGETLKLEENGVGAITDDGGSGSVVVLKDNVKKEQEAVKKAEDSEMRNPETKCGDKEPYPVDKVANVVVERENPKKEAASTAGNTKKSDDEETNLLSKINETITTEQNSESDSKSNSISPCCSKDCGYDKSTMNAKPACMDQGEEDKNSVILKRRKDEGDEGMSGGGKLKIAKFDVDSKQDDEIMEENEVSDPDDANTEAKTEPEISRYKIPKDKRKLFGKLLCPLCAKSMFAWMLKGHIKFYHEDLTKRHICHICAQRFGAVSLLERHLLKYHKIDSKRIHPIAEKETAAEDKV